MVMVVMVMPTASRYVDHLLLPYPRDVASFQVGNLCVCVWRISGLMHFLCDWQTRTKTHLFMGRRVARDDVRAHPVQLLHVLGQHDGEVCLLTHSNNIICCI